MDTLAYWSCLAKLTSRGQQDLDTSFRRHLPNDFKGERKKNKLLGNLFLVMGDAFLCPILDSPNIQNILALRSQTSRSPLIPPNAPLVTNMSMLLLQSLSHFVEQPPIESSYKMEGIPRKKTSVYILDVAMVLWTNQTHTCALYAAILKHLQSTSNSNQ